MKRSRLLPRADNDQPINEWRDVVDMVARGFALNKTWREIVLGVFQYSSLNPYAMEQFVRGAGMDWKEASQWLCEYLDDLRARYGAEAGFVFITQKMHEHFKKTTCPPSWFNDSDWGVRINWLPPDEYNMYVGCF